MWRRGSVCAPQLDYTAGVMAPLTLSERRRRGHRVCGRVPQVRTWKSVFPSLHPHRDRHQHLKCHPPFSPFIFLAINHPSAPLTTYFLRLFSFPPCVQVMASWPDNTSLWLNDVSKTCAALHIIYYCSEFICSNSGEVNLQEGLLGL